MFFLDFEPLEWSLFRIQIIIEINFRILIQNMIIETLSNNVMLLFACITQQNSSLETTITQKREI